jgi:SAM-dependent methyltransferase
VITERPALLPIRAWNAWQTRGTRYAWHKVLRRSLRPWPSWKRRLLYAEPREYWTLRGGTDYFREQEGQLSRTRRAEWLAEQIARYRPQSILEVGCGYGKQLRAIRQRVDVPMVGVDYSPTQLGTAAAYLDGLPAIHLVLASGAELPFPDASFDLVFTSAVILHNPPEIAERIRCEVVRVARRYCVHNQDTDVTYNRYGYDTATWYQAAGIPLAEVRTIPTDSRPNRSQFCVAALWRH